MRGILLATLLVSVSWLPVVSAESQSVDPDEQDVELTSSACISTSTSKVSVNANECLVVARDTVDAARRLVGL
jgi:hypothetical protein